MTLFRTLVMLLLVLAAYVAQSVVAFILFVAPVEDAISRVEQDEVSLERRLLELQEIAMNLTERRGQQFLAGVRRSEISAALAELRRARVEAFLGSHLPESVKVSSVRLTANQRGP